MLSVDDFLDIHGADVTLYRKGYGDPDSDYGDREVTWTPVIIKCWIAPWASMRFKWRGETGGIFTDEDMVVIVKSSVDVTEGEDYIDDGSKLWDVAQVFDMKILGSSEYRLLQLRRRKG